MGPFAIASVAFSNSIGAALIDAGPASETLPETGHLHRLVSKDQGVARDRLTTRRWARQGLELPFGRTSA
jgi:hypothetical protein